MIKTHKNEGEINFLNTHLPPLRYLAQEILVRKLIFSLKMPLNQDIILVDLHFQLYVLHGQS